MQILSAKGSHFGGFLNFKSEDDISKKSANKMIETVKKMMIMK